MRAEQLDAPVDHADGGQVRLCGRAPPGALLICWSVQGGLSNEKTHGVPEVTSRQDRKTRHPTTIGAQEASDPGSLHSAHEGRRTRPEEVDAHV
jgi:hypothetical protein